MEKVGFQIVGQIAAVVGVIGGVLFVLWALRKAWQFARLWWKSRFIHYTGADYEIFDTEKLFNGQTMSPQLMEDYKRFADGMFKLPSDTNLFQNGCLGYPLMMDPKSLELYIEADDSADVLEILKVTCVKFYTGTYQRFQASGTMFEPVYNFAERGSLGAIKMMSPEEALNTAILTRHFTRPLDVKRLYSQESFHVRLDFSRALKLHGEARIKVGLKGTLWDTEPGFGPKKLREKNPIVRIPVPVVRDAVNQWQNVECRFRGHKQETDHRVRL